MYSSSSSYLGGNSARPGPAPPGQPLFQQQHLQQQQFNGQQQGTPGFGPIQPQYTGFPGQSGAPNPQITQPQLQQHLQQPQFTGNFPQNQQSFPNQGFPQQQTGASASAPAPAPMTATRTSQTSSQIAQSFQANASATPTGSSSTSSGVKIPKIRLSFLTAQDQAKFEQLFKSAVGDGQALDGDKVRDLLVRSKLPGSDLMHIWVLSDTTKSGQLLFPEFALAMYLCNLKIVGKDLPQKLPERIANEVSSMVDIISFGVPDDNPPTVPSRTNVPNFEASSRSTSTPSIQQPQPQTSNTQLLSQMTSQPTGFASQYIPPQPTGFQSMTTGLSPQQTQQQQQQQHGRPQNPQMTGLLGNQSQGLSVPSTMNPAFSNFQSSAPTLPLNAQPTGKPGQWGLVNAPASGLPNIDALQQRMMPQRGREGGFTTAGLAGSATVPWAVTKEEKKVYDQLFKAWDGLNNGFIGGDTAIEVMSQSGLDKSDLEKIWTLSDPGNRGRLDMDEFAVAMHLIYRKLNGYPVPNRLPPELVPPSTRNFTDSIGTVKSLLSQDAETRKNTGAFLQPQRTGVSYLKNHSFRDGSSRPENRKDATVFRNDDDAVGYRSSARRRLGAGGRTPSPVRTSSPGSEVSGEEVTLDQLRKMVREKQVLLDAMDIKNEDDLDEDDHLDRKDRRDAEELYRRIRTIQADIDSHPGAALRNTSTDAERRALKRQLQNLTDRLPQLASSMRATERHIADAKLELFRLKDAKSHPGGASSIIGTGPGGSITESDRLKARAKAMMQQRSAALTGRPSDGHGDDYAAASKRLEEEKSEIRREKGNNESMIQDVEDSVRDFSRGLEQSLKEGTESVSSDHERRRWEDGLGVEDEVKDFIFDLQRSSRLALGRSKESSIGDSERGASRVRKAQDPSPKAQATPSAGSPAATSTSSGSYSSYKTAEERAAFIKQQAEQRMAERLAALGLKPPTKPGESQQQKQEREAKEREDRLRQAEAEDAKRDKERQRRLADENPVPSLPMKPSGKKPPPPPTRGSRSGSSGQQSDAKKKADNEANARQKADLEARQKADLEAKQKADLEAKQKAERNERERMIKDQQEEEGTRIRELEAESKQQEDDLAKEREAAESRLKALQEQYKAGKLKKQEKKRKQAAEKLAKEKEARLAAQRAELEAARERELQLQKQLETLDEDESSDDDGSGVETPKDTPAARETPSEGTPSSPAISETNAGQNIGKPSYPNGAASPPAIAPPAPPYSGDTKNPFFKKLSQDTSAGVPNQAPTSITSPSSNELSTNPFHRMTQQEEPASTQAQRSLPSIDSRPSRARPEEDEWSAVGSTEDSSDEEEDRPTGGSAKQLASMLFGTMGPPRPLSAMDEGSSPSSPRVDAKSPVPSKSSAAGPSTPAAPPPAPPLPDMAEPAKVPPAPPIPGSSSSTQSAPPPPPPLPGSSSGTPAAPPPPPPPASGPARPGNTPAVGALLGEIQKGKGLKQVETRDRSQASVAGRVLG